MSISSERLSDFLAELKKNKTLVNKYPAPTTGRLIPATVTDVIDTEKNLYIVDIPIYESTEKSTINIPLKFKEQYNTSGGVVVYTYYLYNSDFSAKADKEIQTRKITMEDKIMSNNIFVYITDVKLSDFLAELKKSKTLVNKYPAPTTGRLIPATVTDVIDTEKNLYIVDIPIYGSTEKSTINIPLKFKEQYNTSGGVVVYTYYLYNSDFSAKADKEIQTRKITMEDKITSKNVFVYDSTPVSASFIFDFDCTLTVRHLYYFLNNLSIFKELYSKLLNDIDINDVNIEQLHAFAKYHLKLDTVSSSLDLTTGKELFIKIIFGSQDRIEILRKMFTDIGKDNLYIASRGIKEQIIKTLDFVGLDGLIKSENITGGNINKTIILKEHIIKENVFYADDDNEEHNNFVQEFSDNLMISHYNDLIYTYTYIPAGTKYKFYKNLVKNIGGGIPNDVLPTLATSIFPVLTQAGGGKDYYKLYLKYKTKYLNLRK